MSLVNTLAEESNDAGAGLASHSEFPHYVLTVRYRCEEGVKQWLEYQGYKPFLPYYKARRKWSDRTVELERLLFPGYLFCPFDIERKRPVLMAPGIGRIVGAGKVPIPVDQRELEAIQAILAAGREVCAGPMLPGQRIRIESGPLKNVEGVLTEIRGRNRLLVSVSLVQRAVSVLIDADEIALL